MNGVIRFGLFFVFVLGVGLACDVPGFSSPATIIKGTIWLDGNQDGIRQDDELLQQGVRVRLVVVNAVVGEVTEVDQTTTDSRGEFLFDVDGGLQYYVQFELPGEEWQFSPKAAGSQENRDSDANPESGESDRFFPIEGSLVRVDAGMFVTLTGIGDRTWVDANGNGLQDSGEEDLPGVRVQLFEFPEDEVDAVLVDSTVTDEHGKYHFDVPGGDYYLEFEAPEGFEFTLADRGSNDDLDSDADPVSGSTEVFEINFQSPAQDHWDAGFIPLGEDISEAQPQDGPVAISVDGGGEIIFTGAFEAQSGGQLEVSFSVKNADGSPAMGQFFATLGDPPSSPNASHSSGELDGNGNITLLLDVNWEAGTTKLYCAFNGVVYEVGEIRILP